MSKTIVFTPEFENKLKRLKVKTKFIKNVNKYKRDSYIGTNHLSLNKESEWLFFIANAFPWSNSPEGIDFWAKIAYDKS
jgi:hypothetical protein